MGTLNYVASATGCLKQFGHIQLIGAECSEGIIIIDLGQSITWANAAALDMHRVIEISELGQTIDEYHARFQVRYVAVLPQTSGSINDASDSEYGRSQPEVLMELIPQLEPVCKSVFRARKMVLFNEAGHPNCIVLVMRKVASQVDFADKFSSLLGMFRGPAAVLRAEDGRVVAANTAYLNQSAAEEPGALAAKAVNFETVVEMDGEAFRLIHCGPQAKAISTCQYPGSKEDVVLSLAPLEAVPMHALDSEMRIMDVSQAWLDWLGYSRNAVIGKKIFEFMPTSSAERFERHTQSQLVYGGKMRDVPADFVNKGGEIVNALISAAMAREGADEAALLVSICVDVTSRTRVEDALASTFAIAPVPMLVRKCDDGRIIDANEAFLKATGFGATDVVGHSFDEFGTFECKKRKDEFDLVVKATGRGEAADVTVKTQHGDTLDCMLTATKIWRFGKECMLFVLQDFSDRSRTELELMSALEAVMKDGSWFSRQVVERLAAMRAPPKSGRRAAALGDLTPRERDVLSLISLGLPDAEIAERLGLTRSTIRNHLSTLYSKINVKNRGSAIIWARDRCLNVSQLPLRPKPLQPDFRVGRQSPKIAQGARVEPKAKTAAAT